MLGGSTFYRGSVLLSSHLRVPSVSRPASTPLPRVANCLRPWASREVRLLEACSPIRRSCGRPCAQWPCVKPTGTASTCGNALTITRLTALTQGHWAPCAWTITGRGSATFARFRGLPDGSIRTASMSVPSSPSHFRRHLRTRTDEDERDSRIELRMIFVGTTDPFAQGRFWCRAFAVTSSSRPLADHQDRGRRTMSVPVPVCCIKPAGPGRFDIHAGPGGDSPFGQRKQCEIVPCRAAWVH